MGALYNDQKLEEGVRSVLAELGRPLDVKVRRAGSFLVAVSPEMTVGKLHAARTRAIRAISRLHPLIVHVDMKAAPLRRALRSR